MSLESQMRRQTARFCEAVANVHPDKDPVHVALRAEIARQKLEIVMLQERVAELESDNKNLIANRIAPLAMSMRDISREVCKKHKVTLAELKGTCRSSPLAKARHEAFYLSRKLLGKSLPEIAKFFGDRDHTTVLHGIRKHEARLCE